MAVELRITIPKKLYDMLVEKAKKYELSLNDMMIYIIERVISE